MLNISLNYLRDIIKCCNHINFWFFSLKSWLLSISLDLDCTWFHRAVLVCWFVLIDFSGARLTWGLYLRSLLAPLNIDRRWCFYRFLAFFLWCLSWCCRVSHLPSTFGLFAPGPTLRSAFLLCRLPLFLLHTFLIAFSPLILLLFNAWVIIIWAVATATTIIIAVMCWMGWLMKFRWGLRGPLGRSGWEKVRLVGGKLVTRFH